MDARTKKLKPLPAVLAKNRILMDSKILVIRRDKKGHLWLGTEKSGVFRYDPSTNSCTNYRKSGTAGMGLPSDGIKDIFVNEDNNVWIATREGLSVFNPSSQQFASYAHDKSDPNSLSYNLLWSFMRDKGGNIWIIAEKSVVLVKTIQTIKRPYPKISFFIFGQSSDYIIRFTEPIIFNIVI